MIVQLNGVAAIAATPFSVLAPSAVGVVAGGWLTESLESPLKHAFRLLWPALLLATMPAAALASDQVIAVSSPAYRSDVSGDTTVRISAPGYRSPLQVKSWLPGGAYGSDGAVASVDLDAGGSGSFLTLLNEIDDPDSFDSQRTLFESQQADLRFVTSSRS